MSTKKVAEENRKETSKERESCPVSTYALQKSENQINGLDHNLLDTTRHGDRSQVAKFTKLHSTLWTGKNE